MIDNKGNKINSFGYSSKSIVKKHPLDEIHYHLLSEHKKTIILNLLYLFSYYSSKVSRHSYDDLPEHYFMELVQHIWQQLGQKLVKNQGLWVDIKILYYSKGCKNSLSFKNFLDLLPTLAVFAEPEINKQEALRSLMQCLIKLYHSRVLPEIDGKLVNIELSIQQNTRSFLSKLNPDLVKLYKLYFPHEITAKCKKDEFKQQSFECLVSFLKDFEVYPKVISLRDVFLIFTESINSYSSQLLYQNQESQSLFRDEGKIYKYSNFIQSMIIISRRVFSRLKEVDNEEELQDQQKYILRTLLEYMQTTKSNTTKKTKFSKERFCFIVLDEHPELEFMKTIQIEGKIRKQNATDMGFFNLLQKMKF